MLQFPDPIVQAHIVDGGSPARTEGVHGKGFPVVIRANDAYPIRRVGVSNMPARAGKSCLLSTRNLPAHANDVGDHLEK